MRKKSASSPSERANALRQTIEEIDREMALLHARKRDAVVELARMAVEHP